MEHNESDSNSESSETESVEGIKNTDLQKAIDSILMHATVETVEVKLEKPSVTLAHLMQTIGDGKKTVLNIGRFGHGKSTLVNLTFGENVAKEGGSMDSQTKLPVRYSYLNTFNIIDTPGLEVSSINLEPLKELIRALMLTCEIDLVWYVRLSTDTRFSEEEVDEIKVWKYDFGLPIILVLNRMSMEEEDDLMAQWKENIEEKKMMSVFSEVITIGIKTKKKPIPENILWLADTTAKLLQIPREEKKSLRLDALSKDARVKLALSCTKKAFIAVGVCVPIATAIGFSPIPFSDFAMLIPVLSSMVIGICASFQLKPSRGFAFTLITSALGAAGLVGALLLGIIKLIPGANFASMAIDGVLSGSLALALGLSLTLTLKQLIIDGRINLMKKEFSDKELLKLLRKGLKERFSDFFKKKKQETFETLKQGKQKMHFELIREEVKDSSYHGDEVEPLDVNKVENKTKNIEIQGEKRQKERKAKIQNLKDNNLNPDDFCCICLNSLACVVTEPCGHMCICSACFDDNFLKCSANLRTCPLCREVITNHVKKFVPKS